MAGRRHDSGTRPKGKGRPELTMIRTAERLLIDFAENLPGKRILCILSPDCQVAVGFAERRPDAEVVCFFLDRNAAEFARSTRAAGIANLEIACGADLPTGPFDLLLAPFPSHGELELARDLLEQGSERVRPGGLIAASGDMAAESHVRTEMKKLFSRPAGHTQEEGVVYVVSRPGELPKPRDFQHEFAFRDHDRLIQAVSRPGLLNHRRVSSTVRPLLESMEVRPGDRVLNLGCDAGLLALAAAMRAEGVQVVAVDSNERAVQCTRRGAELNRLSNVEAHVAAGRWSEGRGTFDLVISCPPYISNSRLADVYIDGAYEALKPGGRLAYGSKQRVWYANELSHGFEQIDVKEVRSHNVITAVKKSSLGRAQQ